ncbi:MAG: CCA tRNA nucleotidyltransferase [Clostridia bacterium]|nr:CCA tRNA nucleotidyltransferase [Clostridia bacterium]
MKIWIPSSISALLERLEQAGYEAYLVGGCVRDAYMGTAPQDYDITTSALPAQTKEVFRGARVIETGLAHGTLTVLTEDGPVEITTYRQDGDYSDHRHPDAVYFTRSLKEDLARRDFTINAMAMDVRQNLVDLFGGRADIDEKIVRCVGDAERRFEEDALRILRALRFAARFGFSLEAQTQAAMERKKELLKTVAAERIFAELCGLLKGDHAAETLAEHREVVGVILPELRGFQRIKNLPSDPAMRLAAVLQKENADLALARLKAPNVFKKTVLMLLENQETAQPENERELHRLAIRLGAENLQTLYRWQGWNAAPLLEFFKKSPCLSIRDLAIDGKALMALGLQGSAIGDAQKYLLEQVAEGLPNEKEILIKAIKNR